MLLSVKATVSSLTVSFSSVFSSFDLGSSFGSNDAFLLPAAVICKWYNDYRGSSLHWLQHSLLHDATLTWYSKSLFKRLPCKFTVEHFVGISVFITNELAHPCTLILYVRSKRLCNTCNIYYALLS